jgi:hypothetical protein
MGVWPGEMSFSVSIVLQEIAVMKVHQKVAAVLVSSLGLVAWGCSGEDVESGVNKTGSGIQSVGKGIEKVGEKVKEKSHDIGKAFENGEKKVVETGKEIKEKAVEAGKEFKEKAVETGKAIKEKITPDKKD